MPFPRTSVPLSNQGPEPAAHTLREAWQLPRHREGKEPAWNVMGDKFQTGAT